MFGKTQKFHITPVAKITRPSPLGSELVQTTNRFSEELGGQYREREYHVPTEYSPSYFSFVRRHLTSGSKKDELSVARMDPILSLAMRHLSLPHSALVSYSWEATDLIFIAQISLDSFPKDTLKNSKSTYLCTRTIPMYVLSLYMRLELNKLLLVPN